MNDQPYIFPTLRNRFGIDAYGSHQLISTTIVIATGRVVGVIPTVKDMTIRVGLFPSYAMNAFLVFHNVYAILNVATGGGANAFGFLEYLDVAAKSHVLGSYQYDASALDTVFSGGFQGVSAPLVIETPLTADGPKDFGSFVANTISASVGASLYIEANVSIMYAGVNS